MAIKLSLNFRSINITFCSLLLASFKIKFISLALLIHRILLDQNRAFNYRYDFIFDRCRAVRQEIVIQNFSCKNTVKLMEPIVMFLSLSIYRLSGSPISVFDSKICSQHLQECLLTCLTCYDEMDRLNQPEYALDNRTVVERIYLMFNLGETSALQRAVRLGEKLKSNFLIRSSIRISLNFYLKYTYKFLRDVKDLPHLICAIASLKLPQARKEMLNEFSIAYNSSTLTVPLDFLQRLLIYDETETLVRDLKDLGIHDENQDQPTAVKFDRKKFDSNKSIVSILEREPPRGMSEGFPFACFSPRLCSKRKLILNSKRHFYFFQSSTSHQFVEQKLSAFHLPDLILLKTLSNDSWIKHWINKFLYSKSVNEEKQLFFKSSSVGGDKIAEMTFSDFRVSCVEQLRQIQVDKLCNHLQIEQHFSFSFRG